MRYLMLPAKWKKRWESWHNAKFVNFRKDPAEFGGVFCLWLDPKSTKTYNERIRAREDGKK